MADRRPAAGDGVVAIGGMGKSALTWAWLQRDVLGLPLPGLASDSPEAAEHLAKELGIHSAIVAGRMRHDSNNYRILNQLVGHRQVRRLFAEVKWSG